MAAAYHLVGETAKADFYHQQTRRFAEKLDADPNDAKLGIPYADSDAVGRSTCESVAASAWFYFNERRVNPFQPMLEGKPQDR